MPINVQCSCGHKLAVPDKFAGKTGKCPKCQNPLKIPAGNPAASPVAAQSVATRQSPAATPRATVAASSSPFDALLDDVGLKKKKGPVCPSCGADIKAGTVICVECGTNFQTGERLLSHAAQMEKPEFDNEHLMQAVNTMRREQLMQVRSDKAEMPWWIIMSFLLGVITLCAAGVLIVDGRFNEPADASTQLGKLQRLPVMVVIGWTIVFTSSFISTFAHWSILFTAFYESVSQGFMVLFVPFYLYFYGITRWADNKTAMKAIGLAIVLGSIGFFLVFYYGGFPAES